MEAYPPSYIDATDSVRNLWPLIAPYLSRHQLLAASLVSRSWHNTFARQLWGDPSSHFPSSTSISDRDETSDFQVLRFRRCARIARQSTRDFTHTLRLPPGRIETSYATYSITTAGVPPDWLLSTVVLLPRLQALILRSICEVDHATLDSFHTLWQTYADRVAAAQNLQPEFGSRIKLLDLSECTQATGWGLLAMLSRLDAVVWLDLSGTRAVSGTPPLTALQSLQQLKVLKLRGCGLRDVDIHMLTLSIGRKLRLLDLGELHGVVNDFSLMGFSYLVDRCLSEASHRPPTYDMATSAPSTAQHDGDAEAFAPGIYRALTSKSGQRLSVEDEPTDGLTHLIIHRGTQDWGHQERHHRDRVSRLSDLILHPGLRYLSVTPYIHFLGDVHYTSQTSSALHYLRMHLYSFLEYLETLHPTSDSATTAESLYKMPWKFPHLKTLVLTGINNDSGPHAEKTAGIITSLISTCARHSYQNRPGGLVHRSFASRGLRKLVLEVSRPAMAVPMTSPATTTPRSRGWNHPSTSRSVTGDADSENLWRYAEEGDFSFFDDDNNDDNDRDDRGTDERGSGTARTGGNAPPPDVVAIVSKFRKDAKERYKAALGRPRARGEVVEFVEGYWPGEIQVVRL